jgi:hypothetical protein
MLSKEELKLKNTLFWNGFKKFMQKYKSSNGKRMNWVSYPSDVKNVYIRLYTDSKVARLSFEIQPKDNSVREIIWEQMTELKKVMEASMKYETIWDEKTYSVDGKIFSRIYWELSDVNYFNENDHEKIYEFLKDRLLEFDEFYQEFKEILISLTD